MTFSTRRLLTCLVTVLAFPAVALAQPGTNRETLRSQRRVSPPEVQRLFDAYALKQAQAVLKLTDAQFAQFEPRMRALHDTRRTAQVTRQRTLRALSDALAAGQEPAIREQLRALSELDTQSAREVQQAYAEIDAVLDVQQQARFRLFEEGLERRKLELLMRARQGRGAPARRQPD